MFKFAEKFTSLEGPQLHSSPELRARVWGDIVERTKPGIVIYPIFWLVVAYGSGFDRSHLALTWVVEGVFLLASLCRFIQFYYLSHWKLEHPKLWIKGLYSGVVIHSLGWGTMFAYALLLDNSAFRFYMGLSYAGIITGGTNSFAPQRNLATCFILSFSLPPMFASIYTGDQWVMSSLVVAVALYTLNLAKQQNREYWRSLANEIILEKQSRTDSLTLLNNRRFFDEKLQELCHLSSRDHVQIAVLVIDCDHFKKVNDELGHDFGDECLRQLATIFEASLPRATDICARYGGEEFSVILAGTGLAGAELVAERIRSKVANHVIKFNGKETRMTVSIGVVSRRLNNFEVNVPLQLFKSADDALYKAKAQGRNCVVSSTDSTEKELVA